MQPRRPPQNYGSNISEHNPAPARMAYDEEIGRSHMTPLWESLHALVPPQPRPQVVPAIGKYAQVRPLVMQTGGVISAEEAVRRP